MSDIQRKRVRRSDLAPTQGLLTLEDYVWFVLLRSTATEVEVSGPDPCLGSLRVRVRGVGPEGRRVLQTVLTAASVVGTTVLVEELTK